MCKCRERTVLQSISATMDGKPIELGGNRGRSMTYYPGDTAIIDLDLGVLGKFEVTVMPAADRRKGCDCRC